MTFQFRWHFSIFNVLVLVTFPFWFWFLSPSWFLPPWFLSPSWLLSPYQFLSLVFCLFVLIVLFIWSGLACRTTFRMGRGGYNERCKRTNKRPTTRLKSLSRFFLGPIGLLHLEIGNKEYFSLRQPLGGTARYVGLLLAPAQGFSRGFFLPLGKIRAFKTVCAYFRPFLVSSSNLHNV